MPGDFPGHPVPSNAKGVGSIPHWESKLLHALRPKNQKIKQKQYCNKLNKDFKNGSHQKNLQKKRLLLIKEKPDISS